jgi:C4-dicarboxylate transporter
MPQKTKNKDELAELKTQAREKTANLILAGFGFVAGLAWNEAIKSLIDTIFVLEKNSLLAKFVYAILVTILIIIVSYFFSKLSNKD